MLNRYVESSAVLLKPARKECNMLKTELPLDMQGQAQLLLERQMLLQRVENLTLALHNGEVLTRFSEHYPKLRSVIRVCRTGRGTASDKVPTEIQQLLKENV